MGFYDAIRAGASGAAADYEVQRSLRFDDDQSSPSRLQRTIQSGGNKNKWTLSVWVKRSQIGNSEYSNSLGGNDGMQIIHAAGSGNRGLIKFKSDDTIAFEQGTDGGYSAGRITTTAKFRDVGAWYHLCFVADYANGTTADRAKIFVNGVRQEVTTSVTFLDGSASDDCIINRDRNHEIGFAEYALGYTGSSNWFNFFCGYMADFYFIDGQAYDSTYFTETNATTGQLVPKEYTGGFGTTGWYLDFLDNSAVTATTLGKDSSGNSNNWTPNGLAVHDSMPDTPTNNFAVMSPLTNYSGLSQGNLRFNNYNDSGGNRSTQATFALPKSGKWYLETRFQEDYIHSIYMGLSQIQLNTGYLTAPTVFYNSAYGTIEATGQSNVSGGSWYNIGSGNSVIISMAIDVDNNSVKFYKDNSLQGTQTIPTLTSTQEYFFTWANSSGGSSSSLNNTFNFGADSTFQGQETSGGNTDANGIGDFKYAPPSGHLALCSANLPTPTILLPNKHFDTLLYTGNGSGQTLSGLNFSPDWLWIKSRSSTEPHELNDQVRGVLKSLSTNSTSGENTSSGRVEAFTSDGFTLGNSGNVNSNSETFVAWNWNGGDTDTQTYKVKVVSDSTDYGHGTGSNKYQFFKSDGTTGFGTNGVDLDLVEGGTYIFDWSDSSAQAHPIRFSLTNDGTHSSGTSAGSEYTTGVTKDDSAYKTTITIASGVANLFYYCQNHSGMGAEINTNTTKGSTNFDGSVTSVVKANTSAGFSIVKYTSTNSDLTFGHGLGVTPAWVLIKNYQYSGGVNWVTWHQNLGDSTILRINLNDAPFSNSNYIVPTSTTIGGKGGTALSNSNNEVIVYCFSEVAGFSRFGKYTGNNVDGENAFIYCGFRPAWIMIKASGNGGDSYRWVIHDATRETGNPTLRRLSPNKTDAESTFTGTTALIDFLSNGFKIRGNGSLIGASVDYVFYAFAEAPFKYARAR